MSTWCTCSSNGVSWPNGFSVRDIALWCCLTQCNTFVPVFILLEHKLKCAYLYSVGIGPMVKLVTWRRLPLDLPYIIYNIPTISLPTIFFLSQGSRSFGSDVIVFICSPCLYTSVCPGRRYVSRKISVFHIAILSFGCWNWSIIGISEDGIGPVVFVRAPWLRLPQLLLCSCWRSFRSLSHASDLPLAANAII